MTEKAWTELYDFWLDCGLPESSWSAARGCYEQYWRLVSAHNARSGLMGNVTVEEFCLKHLADSLAAMRVSARLRTGAVRLADVGAGAGLPGLALAVALPQLRLAAIESNRRKARFLSLAASELGLVERVQVIDRRGREVGQDLRYRGQFDFVTARAVAPADKLIRDCRRLLADDGLAIFYKTPAAIAAEMPLARRQAEKHGFTLQTGPVIDLPAGAGRRQFLILARAEPGAP